MRPPYTRPARVAFLFTVQYHAHGRGQLAVALWQLSSRLGAGVAARWGARTCVLTGSSTAGPLAIVHFGSVGRLWGIFERSKAT